MYILGIFGEVIFLTTISEEEDDDDVEIDEVDDDSDSTSSVLDPYDEVYNKIPKKHTCRSLLRTANFVVQRSSRMRPLGFAAVRGRSN